MKNLNSKKIILFLLTLCIVAILSYSVFAGCGCAAANNCPSGCTAGTAGCAGCPYADTENTVTGYASADAQNAEPTLYREGQPELITETVQQRTRLREHVEEQIQTKQMQLNQELQGYGPKEQKVYQNQNRLRLAVHALLSMENLTSGIGPQVSELARQFNNSVMSTLRLEQRMQNRSRFARFFAGGDNEAGQELNQYAAQNKQRIQQLNQLRENCPCDEETRAMMHEQIQLMQNETTRLQLLAEKEQGSRGMFGWLWK